MAETRHEDGLLTLYLAIWRAESLPEFVAGGCKAHCFVGSEVSGYVRQDLCAEGLNGRHLGLSVFSQEMVSVPSDMVQKKYLRKTSGFQEQISVQGHFNEWFPKCRLSSRM